ncbi:MAG TPA: hypothetical protein GX511_02850, partial [Firmicutes bacterium]|nr:hypothetical protein [Bacillota bacterium]
MSKTVIGVFGDEDAARRAVEELRNSGFGTNEISIIAREGAGRGENAAMGAGNDISGGVTTGGVL